MGMVTPSSSTRGGIMNSRHLAVGVTVLASLFAAACEGRRTSPHPNPTDAGSGGALTGGAGGATGGAGTGGAGTGGANTAGAGGGATAGTGAGSAAGAGGTNAGGAGGGASAGTGGVTATGGANAGGTGGGGPPGTGGATTNAQGPCDIYRAAGQPCVAAYSTVRRLSSTYAGPLYQIRSGSSAQNTGAGGATHDIGQTQDGFADATAVDAACAGTVCTVSLLYDQSGNGSHLSVAKAGIKFGGMTADLDDFESSATKESLMVGGHRVYSLYTEPRQGYRLPRMGEGIPRSMEAQGIYMLADGTHAGTACCWDFGNSPPTATSFNEVNALFFGSGGTADRVATVGSGPGPWYMWNNGAYVWPGGSTSADPTLTDNPNNASLAVKFALGFLKTAPGTGGTGKWALRIADVATATAVTTAYQGAMPRPLYTGGAVVLGVNAYNSNESWGTFYEGAILAGFPADDTEVSVLQNIKAVGYGR